MKECVCCGKPARPGRKTCSSKCSAYARWEQGMINTWSREDKQEYNEQEPLTLEDADEADSVWEEQENPV